MRYPYPKALKPLLIGLLLGFGLLSPAHATDLPTKLEYDAYLNGVKLANGTFNLVRANNKYSISGNMLTSDMWQKMAPWSMLLESAGTMRTMRPTNFKMAERWSDNAPRTLLLQYDMNNQPELLATSSAKPAKGEEVAAEQTAGTRDPLSASLAMIYAIAQRDNCKANVRVFDGKRRFDMLMSDAGTATLTPQPETDFSGETRKCSLQVRLLHGSERDMKPNSLWHDGNGRDRAPIMVWLGKIRDDLPAMPVRIETSTLFGYVAIYLKNWSPNVSY